MPTSSWSKPRLSIAKNYHDNDFGYVFRNTRLFIDFLAYSGHTIKDLRGKKILDFGCGTGTLARMLALTGARVTGYDPTPECITEALVIEPTLIAKTQLAPRLLTSSWDQVEYNFNIVICVDVLSYLDTAQHRTAIDQIIESLKDGGVCYLWVNKHTTTLPVSNREDMQQSASDTVVLEGIKQDGKIESFRKCFR